jgi:hypothetical protein
VTAKAAARLDLKQELKDPIVESCRRFAGRHRKIYLSDPRRADPIKLKTIIRQPFK